MEITLASGHIFAGNESWLWQALNFIDTIAVSYCAYDLPLGAKYI